MVLKGDEQDLSDKTLSQLFESAVNDSTNKDAIVDVKSGSTSMTFGSLNKKANKLARILLNKLEKCRENHNPDGDHVVAVCMEPSSTLIVALLAILKAGAAYLPLAVSFSTTRIARILEDAKPSLVLVHGDPEAFRRDNETATENIVDILHLEDLEGEVEEKDEKNIPGEDVGKALPMESTAAILYTSGSTGVPNGVRLPHRAILNRLSWQWKTFPYTPDEVCCFKTSLTFVDSISEIFAPLLRGNKLIIIPKHMTLAVDQLVEVLEKEKVGRLVLVPTLLRSILLYCSQSEDKRLANLKLWVCSGEVFPPDLLMTFFRTFTGSQVICNFYGSTEVMGDVTYTEFKAQDDAEKKLFEGKVPIGKAISNTEIHLLDSNGSPVEEGQVGGVYVCGLNLARGYVGGALGEKFIKNAHSHKPGYEVLYRTGDLARNIGDCLIFEGRADSQIKVRGHRVDLMEIQKALQSLEGIKKCQALAYHPGKVHQAVIAYFSSSNTDLSIDSIEIKLAQCLQEYMMPELIPIEELPVLLNGKVDSQALLSMYEDRTIEPSSTLFDTAGADVEDRGTAQILLQTVAKVLGPSCPKSLSLKDNFFNIGGNSLNSLLTVTSLKDVGFNVDLMVFLQAPSLVDVLKAMKTQKEVTPVYMLKEESLIEDKQSQIVTEKYRIEELKWEHKALLPSFMKTVAEKEVISLAIKISPDELTSDIGQQWDVLLQQNTSYIVRKLDTGKVVGLSLNHDHGIQFETKDSSEKFASIVEIMEDLETNAEKHLPPDVGTLLSSYLVATTEDMSPIENVELITLIEREDLRRAKDGKYAGIIASNSSLITQQICTDVLGYKSLVTYNTRRWKNKKGETPFLHATEKARFICMARLF